MPDASANANLIEINAESWRQNAGGPFRFKHNLLSDERLTHESLVALASRLPEELVETNTSDLPDVFPSDDVPELDRKPGAIMQDIVELRRWIALSNVEQDDEYRTLVNHCLEPVAKAIGDFEGGMTEREGYIFVSPSSSTTPAHLDYEHNIFLQVLGTKEITVGFIDPETEARTLESMHGGHYGRSPRMPDDPEVFRLGPGEGMYISPALVHMVRTLGDEMSISVSLVFHTQTLDRGARVHAANHDLRRIGLSPRPAGHSRTRDAVKSGAVIVWRRFKGLWPGRM